MTDAIDKDREVRDGTLSVRIERSGEGCTVAVRGEMDRANAATLAAELERFEGDAVATLVLDLSELEFIDSTGIAVLVAVHRRRGDGRERLRLIRSRALEVQRVMEVTGLDRELPFDPMPV